MVGLEHVRGAIAVSAVARFRGWATFFVCHVCQFMCHGPAGSDAETPGIHGKCWHMGDTQQGVGITAKPTASC